MELSKQDMRKTKGLAILFMVVLHLFQRLDYQGVYEPVLYICGKPLAYYIGLLSDCCVAIYCFCSGYAQYLLYEKLGRENFKNNIFRLGKLLINYWLIVLIFSGLGLILNNTQRIPGDWRIFLSNFFLISKSYNGAWWFVLTYIILLLFSYRLYQLIKKFSPIWILSVACFLFILTHFVKNSEMNFLGNGVFGWILLQIVLVLNSLLPYLFGSIFIKYHIYSSISMLLTQKYKVYVINSMMIVIIVIISIGHAIIPSSIVAPFTGVVIICCFNLIKNRYLEQIFIFLGKHSTNIWLTHMFFYTELFGGLVFKLRYPPLILIFMIIMTLITSYIVNIPYSLIVLQFEKLVKGK